MVLTSPRPVLDRVGKLRITDGHSLYAVEHDLDLGSSHGQPDEFLVRETAQVLRVVHFTAVETNPNLAGRLPLRHEYIDKRPEVIDRDQDSPKVLARGLALIAR